MCRGYKSGNRCIYGYRCLCRQADGKRNLSARSKISDSRNSCCSAKKKRPRLCFSKLRSNEFYSTESWRFVMERFGGTDAPGTKLNLGKKRATWRYYPKWWTSRNPCAPSSEEQPPEETSLQADFVSKEAWNLARKYASSSRTLNYVSFSCEGARDKERRSYVYCVFGSFNAQY